MNPSGTRLAKLISDFPELARQPEWENRASDSWYRQDQLALNTLVSNLIEPALDRAVARGDNEFVKQLLAFLDLMADGKQEIGVVNGLRARMAKRVPGISSHIVFPRLRTLFVTDRPNIMSPKSLHRIREPLARHDVIFGFHAFYFGGSSPDLKAWISFESFMDDARKARPGDLFELWSLDDLCAKGLALADVCSGDDPLNIDRAAGIVRAYLAESHDEVLIVWRRNGDSMGDKPSCGVWSESDWEESLETLIDELTQTVSHSGEAHAFRMTDLYQESSEGYMNMLLAAKIPNEHGEVPIGGAY